jgi:hypothetical protein
MNQWAEVRNEISGVVHGTVVQAGTANVTLAAPAKELLDQLHQTQRLLIVSQRAEQRSGLLVSILYVALARAFRLIGELASEYDQLQPADRRNDERLSMEDRLGAAHATRDRTQRQLERAETERQHAIRLVSSIGRRIVRLQREILSQAPAEAVRLEPFNLLDVSVLGREDILNELNTDLDRIEHLLDTQSEELTQLDAVIDGQSVDSRTPRPQPLLSQPNATPQALNPSATITSPVTVTEDKLVQAERLHEIISDNTISFVHRVDAAWQILIMGERYFGDVDRHLRLIIMHRSIAHPQRLRAIAALARLGRSHWIEAAAILRQDIDDSSCKHLNRIQSAGDLAGYGGDDQAYALAFLCEVAEGPAENSVRINHNLDAARIWHRYRPENHEKILTAMRRLAGNDKITDSEKKRVIEFIDDVTTDPRISHR